MRGTSPQFEHRAGKRYSLLAWKKMMGLFSSIKIGDRGYSSGQWAATIEQKQ